MSDSEYGGRFPGWAAATAWTLYALHAALTFLSAARRPRPLSVGKPPATMMGSALGLIGFALYR